MADEASTEKIRDAARRAAAKGMGPATDEGLSLTQDEGSRGLTNAVEDVGYSRAEKIVNRTKERQDAAPAVKYAKRPYEGPVSHGGEDDQHLFGPTGRPEEHGAFGAQVGNIGFQPPPDGKAQWYTALRAAAKDPDAPDSVKEIWSLVDMMQANSTYSTQPFGAERAAAKSLGQAEVGAAVGTAPAPDAQAAVNASVGDARATDTFPGQTPPPPSEAATTLPTGI